MFKPMLARDWDEQKLQFPVIGQPKIDGVRGLNPLGFIVGRSLKTFANRHVNELMSKDEYQGFDMEMTVGDNMYSDSLCRDTTSALTTIQGEPDIHGFAFDVCSVNVAHLRYESRLAMLTEHVNNLHSRNLASNIHVIEHKILTNMDDVLQYDEENLDLGLEGTILRDPGGIYKHGRSTIREQYLLRIKRYRDCEGKVISLEEAEINNNEAQINELGYTFRTSHKENKIPAGRIGAMIVLNLETG